MTIPEGAVATRPDDLPMEGMGIPGRPVEEFPADSRCSGDLHWRDST